MMLRNGFSDSGIFITEGLNGILADLNNCTRFAIYQDNVALFDFESRNNPKGAIHIKSEVIAVSQLIGLCVESLVASGGLDSDLTVHTHLAVAAGYRLEHSIEHIAKIKHIVFFLHYNIVKTRNNFIQIFLLFSI